MNMKKVLALALALVLIVGATVAGTVAWLMDKTENVTNTFTVGDIDIDLKEHALNDAGTDVTDNEVTSENTYKIVPGDTQPKDPFVRFVDNSEPCWLFVKIEEKNNTISGKGYGYVTYTVDPDWTPLTDNPGVYYKQLKDLTATGTVLNILKDKQVTYNNGLTKAELDAVGENKPQLIFTAYAVQLEAATDAAAAWVLANSTT